MFREVALICQRELRALLRSPVAVLFVGLFLVASYAYVFSAARFFARNLADIRPLFVAQPLLLIFLTATLTMRMWSEEHRSRTSELLATLPLRTTSLVAGKFLAALLLVGVALLLTAPFPLMVASVAPLDPGPIIGGYLAAALLAAFYVSLGLCVSAMTSNQVVALLVSIGVGALFYLIGDPALTNVLAASSVDSIRRISTAARFESIERGVVDLRDVIFYAAGCVTFLTWNVAVLRARRLDARSGAGRRRTLELALLALLVAGNAIVLNLWVEELPSARVDLTASQRYRIEPVTRQSLQALEEELRVDAIISERTHPDLAPLVPEVRDMLREYEALAGGRVQVRFIDPEEDPSAAARLREEHDIDSVPMRVRGRNRESVVDVWFHLVLRYGTQNRVLTMDDLVEVDASGRQEQVRLRNLEFDLTRAIRRLTRRFQSLDALLESHRAHVTIRLLASQELPEDLEEPLAAGRDAARRIATRYRHVSFEELSPTASIGGRQTWVDRYALLPTVSSAMRSESHFFELIVDNGEEFRRVPPFNFRSAEQAEARLINTIQGMYPGRLTRVGLFAPRLGGAASGVPPGWSALHAFVDRQFRVEVVDLLDGRVPEQIDVLLVAAPREMNTTQQFAIDQFAMRGGPVVVLSGSRTISSAAGRLTAEDIDADLLELLRSWGVSIGPDFVFDPQAAPFPSSLSAFERVSPRPESYPYFVDARGAGLNRTHPVSADLANLTLPWASSLEVRPARGVSVEVLARSSAESRRNEAYDIYPPLEPSAGDAASVPLAVVLRGRLPSHFAAQPPPQVVGEEQRTLDTSVETARVVVISSSELVSDLVLDLRGGSDGFAHQNNLVFLSNLLDWTGQDEALLTIRAAGAHSATLPAIDAVERRALKRRVWLPALLALLALGLIPQLTARLQRPSRALRREQTSDDTERPEEGAS